MELPLFPLNTVLFPGTPINLHIFEERYKLMMNQCIQKRQVFGVVLIENNTADTDAGALPHSIGCTAQITQVQPLSQGRMNIVAVGRERFRILSLNFDQPYLVGTVELFPMTQDNPLRILSAGQRLRTWIDRYLQIMQQAGQIQYDAKQLPNDPIALAYLGSVLLQIPLHQKQDLLASDRATVMLASLCNLYRREVALLNVMLSPPESGQLTPFSLS